MATYEANIDEGTVSFEDGTKSQEEYAPARKVRVELKFQVYEGEDGGAVLQFVGDQARAEVARLLGGAAPVVSAPVGEAPAPATRTRRTKAQIEADAKAAAELSSGAASGTTAGSASGATNTGASTDAGSSADLDFDPTADTGDKAGADDGAVDLSEFDVQPEAEVEEKPAITDADLNSAVQKKNAELSDPPRIRELIGSYNPDPKSVFQLRQIPADQRQEFLNKLGALKKAA